jgi:hypothetical protein
MGIDRWPALAGVALAVGACEKQATESAPSGSASAATPTTPEAAPDAAQKPPAPTRSPRDMDVAELQQKLGCKQRRVKGACEVLAAFAKAERWDGKTPSGDGRWIGRFYTVEQGEETAELRAIRAHQVPLAKVGPHELPLMVGTAEIPDRFLPFVKKMAARVERGRKARRRSHAYKFMADFKPEQEWGAINTEGVSVLLLFTDQPVYLRKRERKELFWVSPAERGSAKPGDGTYAKLWMVVW